MGTTTSARSSSSIAPGPNCKPQFQAMIAAAQGSKGAAAPGSAIGSAGGPESGDPSSSGDQGATSANGSSAGNSTAVSAQTDSSASSGFGPGRGSLEPSEAEMYRI